MPQADRRTLCVSLHDVAPATLTDCARTLSFLDNLRISPVALLVVPDYHGSGRVDRDRGFCRFLDLRAQRGDEIVLHGLRHVDVAPLGGGFAEWFERRIYTAGEGEFSRLTGDIARDRILRGLAVLHRAGWRPDGFVAPAWLMSLGTVDALETLPFRYCATRDFVVPLGGAARIEAPSLVVSTRSRWRRALSPVWNRARLACRSKERVLRVALHPKDIRYPDIRTLWQELLLRLADRQVVTEGRLVSGR